MAYSLQRATSGQAYIVRRRQTTCTLSTNFSLIITMVSCWLDMKSCLLNILWICSYFEGVLFELNTCFTKAKGVPSNPIYSKIYTGRVYVFSPRILFSKFAICYFCMLLFYFENHIRSAFNL